MVRAVLWQRVEGAIIFAVGLVLFWHRNETMSWWGAFLVFFVPDLSFLGYLLGPRTGPFAITRSIFMLLVQLRLRLA
jgi:hypothetical protein